MKPAEIEVLARKAQSGEVDFSTLWTAVQDRVRNQVAGSIGRRYPDDVDDLCQQIAIAVWKNLAGFKGAAKFTSWLYRITDNACMRFLRDTQRLHEVPLLDEEGEDIHHLVDPKPTPDARMISKQVEDSINGAIDSLPGQQSSIFRLRAEGMSHEKIAATLGIDEHSSRTMHSRAVKKLREQFSIN